MPSDLTIAFLDKQDDVIDYFMHYVGSAVELALSPWDPGEITVWLGESFLAMDTLTITVSKLPRLPFSAALDTQAFMNACCVDEVIQTYADEAFLWFRYRRAPSIGDHILLGEE